MMKPAIGEAIIGMTTLSQTLLQPITVPAARPEPTRPPIMACEDDEGRPFHQVIRFHTIAPTRAANTIDRPSTPDTSGRMSAIVLATPTPTNEPSRFITAARASAARGVSARVETEVAIALAASWNPLV